MEPPKWITAPETKLLPVIESRNEPVPAVALEGERLLMLGVGLETTRLMALEAPTPGLTTVMAKLPALAMSLAEIWAFSCVMEDCCGDMVLRRRWAVEAVKSRTRVSGSEREGEEEFKSASVSASLFEFVF